MRNGGCDDLGLPDRPGKGLAEATAKEEMVVAGLAVFHRVLPWWIRISRPGSVTEGKGSPGAGFSPAIRETPRPFSPPRGRRSTFSRGARNRHGEPAAAERVRDRRPGLDTRKTVPASGSRTSTPSGWGAASNHRFGLSGAFSSRTTTSGLPAHHEGCPEMRGAAVPCFPDRGGNPDARGSPGSP